MMIEPRDGRGSTSRWTGRGRRRGGPAPPERRRRFTDTRLPVVREPAFPRTVPACTCRGGWAAATAAHLGRSDPRSRGTAEKKCQQRGVRWPVVAGQGFLHQVCFFFLTGGRPVGSPARRSCRLPGGAKPPWRIWGPGAVRKRPGPRAANVGLWPPPGSGFSSGGHKAICGRKGMSPMTGRRKGREAPVQLRPAGEPGAPGARVPRVAVMAECGGPRLHSALRQLAGSPGRRRQTIIVQPVRNWRSARRWLALVASLGGGRGTPGARPSPERECRSRSVDRMPLPGS